MQDTIVVLSKSRRFAGLVARTLRCRQIYCLPAALDTPASEICKLSPKGVLLAEPDGAADALDGLDFEILNLDVPVLALGGAVAPLCSHFGGGVGQPMEDRTVTLSLQDAVLFQDISGGERRLRGVRELLLPDSLQPLATATERVIGFQHAALPLYGFQYPVERNDPDAAQLLYNFARGICGCRETWTDDAIIDQALQQIRDAAPEGRVLCAVSGGVDSTVCARLASLVVGSRLVCLFVDTGLLRRGEPEEVMRAYQDQLGLTVAHVDARKTFLDALSGVSSWDEKEQTASRLMTRILQEQLSGSPDIHTFVMGTNFNDTLFGCAPSAASVGKSALCQPIGSLFKEEVRRLALALELPASIVMRQPFPSSGLALRIMGAVTEERLNLLRVADDCFTSEIREGGYDRRLWQYYATLIESPDRPDGYAVCLRAVQAQQENATAARLPFDVLERATRRIRDALPCVSRVVYDLTPSAHYGELE